jgi:hypothetical protein
VHLHGVVAARHHAPSSTHTHTSFNQGSTTKVCGWHVRARDALDARQAARTHAAARTRVSATPHTTRHVHTRTASAKD